MNDNFAHEEKGGVMSVIIFGAGVFFMNRREIFEEEDIVAFIDNDKNKWGKKINNIPVFSPDHIKDFFYDQIVIMSKKEEEIKAQLIHDLGIDEKSILNFEQYCEYSAQKKEICRLVIHYKRNNFCFFKNKKNILIITHELSYTGGALAAFYAALSLKEKGFDVVIATKKTNPSLTDEIVNKNITVFTQELIEYCEWEQINWIEQFDYVIINTLRLGTLIEKLAGRKQVLWWVHESKAEYEYLDPNVIRSIDSMNIETYVVSDVALHTFCQYFQKLSANVLCYGIPDTCFTRTTQAIKGKTVFAVIGTIVSIKAQDIFLKAITLLTQEERDKSEFLVIGACQMESKYGSSVLQQIKDIPQAKWLGELTREEIETAYRNIDVVVVPSRQESMSIVMTETFMYGKIGIASDVIGIAEYMKDGENGLIFKSEDIRGLAEKMSWVLSNKEKLNSISVNARRTYEENFTLEKFGNKIERILLNM